MLLLQEVTWAQQQSTTLEVAYSVQIIVLEYVQFIVPRKKESTLVVEQNLTIQIAIFWFYFTPNFSFLFYMYVVWVKLQVIRNSQHLGSIKIVVT